MSILFRAALCTLMLIPVPALAESQPKAAETAEQPRIICKKFAETGSLVKKRKVCLTAKQWAEVSSNAQNRGREMQTLISTERGN